MPQACGYLMLWHTGTLGPYKSKNTATLGDKGEKKSKKELLDKFDIKVCELSERFAAVAWVGFANIGQTEGKQPCYHINDCSIQTKATAESRKKHTLWTKSQVKWSMKAFAVKNKAKNILVGLYPPSNEIMIKRTAQGGNHSNSLPVHHPPFILWHPRYRNTAAKNED